VEPEHTDGSAGHSDQGRARRVPTDTGARRRPTLNGAVRRRRADRAFYIRLAGIIRQNERALDRLRQ